MSSSHFVLQGLDMNDDHIEAIQKVLSLSPVDRGLIATAFMNSDGAQMLIDLLGSNASVYTIFVGIRNGVTTQQALRLLLDNGINPIVVDTATQAFIFHPKVYLASNHDEARLVVGSANATSGGFAKNVEASMYTEYSMLQEHEIVDKVYKQFDELMIQFPENVFRIKSEDDYRSLVDDGLLIDQGHELWRATTRVQAANRTETRKRMQLHTRPLPITRRPRNSKSKIAPIQKTNIGVAITPNNLLLWRSGKLKRRDLCIPTAANTNPTGSMNFKKGDLSQDFDQRVYFRYTVFANENWKSDTNPRTAHYERCTCKFRIIIKGIDYGIYPLELSHNTKTDTATHKQRNSVTHVSWGRDVGKLVASEELLDCVCSLYAPDETGAYTFVFDEE